VRRDCLDLDLAAERQRACLIRQTGREAPDARELLAIQLVDGAVVVDVRE